MSTTLLTDIGYAKITTASGTNRHVSITEIALGDGLGATYDPSNNQKSLRRERARLPIETRSQIGASAWRVKAEFPPETSAFFVREMGFYDQDGALIAIWAGKDVQPRQTGAIAYLIDHVLDFSRVADGLVIVEAPDDEIFDFALATLRNQASQALVLFKMIEAINANGEAI